jgi:hypothetical protein
LASADNQLSGVYRKSIEPSVRMRAVVLFCASAV